mgnify:CR=1 FL=1
MADLMAGPNAPLTKAFISCGWQCIIVDWLLDDSHDLSDERRQHSLSKQLEEVIFIAAAIDCSTKSRAREIPRKFGSSKTGGQPLVLFDPRSTLMACLTSTAGMPKESTSTTKPATTSWERFRSCGIGGGQCA